MSWSVESISVPQGVARAIMPEVISVSRATDVPAFHGEWFRRRWEEGYCKWQNPFNARQIQHVAFKKVKAAVFWSKNPAPFWPVLDWVEKSGLRYYFQFTLNDYEQEGLEPGVPALGERVACFQALAERCPVIWRYDPVVFGAALDIAVHIECLANLMRSIGRYASRLVFSFVDLGYRRAKNSVSRFNPDLRAPTWEEMRSFATELSRLRNKLAPKLRLAACATALDLRDCDIVQNRCIDPELLEQLCQGRSIWNPLPGLSGETAVSGMFNNTRDKGQRKACRCAPAKDVGSYRMVCGHGCVYCYAGHSRASGSYSSSCTRAAERAPGSLARVWHAGDII